MEKKFFYEAPEVEQIELRFEQSLLTGSPGGAGGNDTIVDDDDLS